MKGIKLSALALATMLSHAVSAQSLEQAISHTLKTNPEVKASYNDFMSYVYDNKAAVREYYPSWTLPLVWAGKTTKQMSVIETMITPP